MLVKLYCQCNGFNRKQIFIEEKVRNSYMRLHCLGCGSSSNHNIIHYYRYRNNNCIKISNKLMGFIKRVDKI